MLCLVSSKVLCLCVCQEKLERLLEYFLSQLVADEGDRRSRLRLPCPDGIVARATDHCYYCIKNNSGRPIQKAGQDERRAPTCCWCVCCRRVDGQT
jgi:hypothetical protein